MDIYNKRSIKILDLFINSKKELNGDNIALSVGVTSRTVRNDIKELNSFLKEYDSEVISEIGFGYILKINNEKKFEQLKKKLNYEEKKTILNNSIVPSVPEDRVNYIISKLLMNSLNNGENIDQFDLADELFISITTLKKDIKSIDKIISKFDLKTVTTQKNGIRIIGDETKIRYCISEFIFNRNNLTTIEESNFYKDIFSKEEIDRIKEFLLGAITKYDIRLTDISFKNLIIHSLIMLKRFENEKKIDYDERDIKILENSNEFKCARTVINKIQNSLNVDLEKEVYYLTQHLISSKKFLIEDLDDDYEYKKVIEMILYKIRESTKIELFDDSQLINGLAIHLSVALKRLRFDMNIRNEFLDSMKNSYPLAFELAVIASETIESMYHIKTNENETGFLAIHFGAALERKGLNEKKELKNAIIVCISGVATTMLLKEKIKQNFRDRINVVKTCPVYELTQEMVDSVDLILTTVPVEKFHSNKIKRINILLNDDDLDNIEKIINYDEEKKNEIDYSSIFRKDLFFRNVKAMNKEEILEKITNTMIQKNYITEYIKRSIYRREEIATTELGCLVAMPHALLNDMEDAMVSVTILEKPIIWKNEKVQIVLLLNIPQSKYEIWESVFKNLYKYLIDNCGSNKLIKGCSYQNFIDDLKDQEQESYIRSSRRF